MKFKFPFETLMKSRKAQRDEAERDYRLAQAKALEQKSKLAKMKEALASARAETQTVRESGGKLASALISIEEYIVGQKVRIQDQYKVLKGLEEIMEQKRLILIEAAKELKILEKLKEKRFQEFKIQVRKQELKNLDEISVMRAGRSKAV